MTNRSRPRRISRAALYSSAALFLGLLAAPLLAIEGQKGEFSWSWDNTLSYGLLYRLDDPDPEIVGLAAGGKAFSVNGDDGNQNYETGIASSVLKWNSEIQLNYKSVGLFTRAYGFWDYENENGERARTPLSEGALDRVGSRLEIRDAFAWWKFHLGEKPGEIRAGNQVLNWGESTFIQGGINAINPFDVSALRVPGAELRDALLPIGAVVLSLKPTENTSFDGYYQYDWEETVGDPVGGYFSTTDLAGAGATKVMLGFGRAPDTIPVGAPVSVPVGVAVPRGTTREGDESGQYGAAFRLFAPRLGGTEFGLYYLSYTSRLPIISAVTGTLTGLGKGNYAASAHYFLEYPDDISLYGLSFNSQLGRSGIALQGEVSMRQDVPLQVDDVELLYAALSPLRLVGSSLGNLLANTNQLGKYGFNEEIQGYRRFDTMQVQMTATKLFSRVLGSDQFTIVAEAAWSKVDNLPDQKTLRLEAPGTYTSGNQIHQIAGVQPGTEPASAFPTDTAWGYVIAGRFDYNNAIGAVNLLPRFSWAHDVDGTSPGPGGSFIDGRQALTLGLGFQYQINWEWDLSYTQYMGADRYNLINDRDFVAANLKYSF